MPLCVEPAGGGLAERVGRVDDPGQAQVEHPDGPGVVEHEVARLDVAVDDPLGMRGLQPAGRLDQAVDRLVDRHRPALADDAVEVASLDVFHDQEMDAAVLVGVLRGDEVGVLEPAGGLDLAAEPHHAPAVARERRREDLQGADPPQPAMPRLEDHAHAALAELVEDEVVADQQAAALLLVDRGRLVGRQLAGLDQGARQAQHPFGGIGGEGRELIGVDQADLDERSEKSSRPTASPGAGPAPPSLVVWALTPPGAGMASSNPQVASDGGKVGSRPEPGAGISDSVTGRRRAAPGPSRPG